MNKKYFLATTLIFGLLCSAACSAIVSAYSDDPYGPVVDCDSELPMDELIQCIDEKYAAMDKIYEPTFIKIYKQSFANKSLQRLNEYGVQNISIVPLKISQFFPLKNQNKNVCDIGYYSAEVPCDTYKEKTIALSNMTVSFVGLLNQENTVFWQDVFSVSYPYKYLRSYKSKVKDIIIGEVNNQIFIYTVGFEAIRLKSEKNLLSVKLIIFSPMKPEKEGFRLSKDKQVYERINPDGSINYLAYMHNNYSPFIGYEFWVWGDIKEVSNNLSISLDKRDNPSMVYIKLGSDIYQLNLT